MSIFGIFKKHEKIETYEKRTAPMAKIIPFPEREKKGLEELKFININQPVKKERTVGEPIMRSSNNPI